MIQNIFEQAAQYARWSKPYERNLLIAPVETLQQTVVDFGVLPRYPVLYVTKLGYVPHATKMEILRRGNPNLYLIGGRDKISEWVVYVLSTFTKGKLYRIVENSDLI